MALTATRFKWQKQILEVFVIRFESGNRRVMDQKEIEEMMNKMICKNIANKAKRFWVAQRRLFSIPFSEKQSMRIPGGIRMDA